MAKKPRGGSFRIQKRLTILPGVRLNFSKSGISATIGVRGAHITIGRRGVRRTFGIPGTGISYTTVTPLGVKSAATNSQILAESASAIPKSDGCEEGAQGNTQGEITVKRPGLDDQLFDFLVKVALWLSGLLFILVFIVRLVSEPLWDRKEILPTIFFLLIGLVLFPPTFDYFVQKTKLQLGAIGRTITVIVLFLATGAILPAEKYAPPPRPAASTPAAAPSTPSAASNATSAAAARAEQRQNATTVRAGLFAKQLRASMREPDNFELDQVLVMDNGAACFQYRVSSGFGGKNVEKAVMSPKFKFLTGKQPGFARLWNRHCAKRRGENRTRIVNRLMNRD